MSRWFRFELSTWFVLGGDYGLGDGFAAVDRDDMEKLPIGRGDVYGFDSHHR